MRKIIKTSFSTFIIKPDQKKVANFLTLNIVFQI